METEELQLIGATIDFASVINTAADSSESNVFISDESGSGSGLGSGSGIGNGNVTTSEPVPDDFGDLLLYSNLSVVLPPDIFSEIEYQNETGVWFNFYLVPSLFPVSSGNFVVGSPVVAATVAGHEVSNLLTPVVITLQSSQEKVSLSIHNIIYQWDYTCNFTPITESKCDT